MPQRESRGVGGGGYAQSERPGTGLEHTPQPSAQCHSNCLDHLGPPGPLPYHSHTLLILEPALNSPQLAHSPSRNLDHPAPAPLLLLLGSGADSAVELAHQPYLLVGLPAPYLLLALPP